MTLLPTEGAVLRAVAGAALLVLGGVLGRPDVAVLGAPLVAAAGWGWLRRPRGAGIRPRLRAPGDSAGPGDPLRAGESVRTGEVAADLELPAAEGVETVRLRVHAPGHRAAEAIVAARRDRSLRLSLDTVRTGRLEVFPLDWAASGPEDAVRSSPRSLPARVVTLLPRTRPLRELPLPFRLQGLTGGHDSRRGGDGGDLRDINLFTPGDRLRRIDWRVTARRAGSSASGGGTRLTELYVRRTFATADATVMLVIDSRDEVGPDVSTWGDLDQPRQDEATSLDIAREAAASLAQHYLERGDRVGMEDLGRFRTPVVPAGGRRHLHRLLQRLVLAQPDGNPARRVRPPHVPSGALVVLFSTFLDDEAATMSVLWRSAGHRVVAVDVLPVADTGALRPMQAVAFEILRLERAERLRELARAGIEVVRWEGDASEPDAAVALAALARTRVRR
ncbi:DUF58 domain-containing protein [Planctomonas deserti]|uniref:DUF58 domain-containing protein n=1 Tax=Planctomonas deserti TaxID=2144185 RepID=UPI000D35403C|nr:DUF58 domain-containing protein [Planctomonas deserti]